MQHLYNTRAPSPSSHLRLLSRVANTPSKPWHDAYMMHEQIAPWTTSYEVQRVNNCCLALLSFDPCPPTHPCTMSIKKCFPPMPWHTPPHPHTSTRNAAMLKETPTWCLHNMRDTHPFPLCLLKDLHLEWPIFCRKHTDTLHACNSWANDTKNVKLWGGCLLSAHLSIDPCPPTHPEVTTSVKNPCCHCLIAIWCIDNVGEDHRHP